MRCYARNCPRSQPTSSNGFTVKCLVQENIGCRLFGNVKLCCMCVGTLYMNYSLRFIFYVRLCMCKGHTLSFLLSTVDYLFDPSSMLYDSWFSCRSCLIHWSGRSWHLVHNVYTHHRRPMYNTTRNHPSTGQSSHIIGSLVLQ